MKLHTRCLHVGKAQDVVRTPAGPTVYELVRSVRQCKKKRWIPWRFCGVHESQRLRTNLRLRKKVR